MELAILLNASARSITIAAENRNAVFSRSCSKSFGYGSERFVSSVFESCSRAAISAEKCLTSLISIVTVMLGATCSAIFYQKMFTLFVIVIFVIDWIVIIAACSALDAFCISPDTNSWCEFYSFNFLGRLSMFHKWMAVEKFIKLQNCFIYPILAKQFIQLNATIVRITSAARKMIQIFRSPRRSKSHIIQANQTAKNARSGNAKNVNML